MTLKEILNKIMGIEYNIKPKTQSVTELEEVKTKDKEVTNYSIDKKVDEFIAYYDKKFVKGHSDDITEYFEPRETLNIIEKMAVWYELRHPDYEVCKRYPGTDHDNLSTDNIYIRENQAIKDIEDVLDGDNREMFNMSVEGLHWEDILSPRAFISALPSDEKWFLSRPKYPSYIPLYHGNNLCLSAKGKVTEGKIKDRYNEKKYDLSGLHVSEALEVLKSENYPLEKDCISEVIEYYKNRCELKEKFLDIVMYRIIERGGTRIGARRAFMFALDFNRNIDIPMIYGYDSSDPGTRDFIREYMKAGGRTDLECLVGYFHRKSETDPLDTITIQKLMEIGFADRYTYEETSLHQSLVNALNNGVPVVESLDREQQVKEKRLIRKLENSRRV